MEIENYRGERSLKSLCDHCGNITFQSLKHLEVCSEQGRAFTYTFSRCTICGGVVLRKHPGDWNAPVRRGIFDEDEPEYDYDDFEQLWPPTLSLPSEAPKRVREIYEEARIIRKHSASSFVVQIGRALEAITKEQNAQGRSLFQRIDWLIEQEQLPELFGQMGHLNRIFRNWGAHDADIDVTLEDAQIVDEFFQAIVEYLYVAPAKVKKVSALIERRKVV